MLPAALLVGGTLAFGIGVQRGWHFVTADFGALALASGRAALYLALPALVALVVGFEVLVRPMMRRLPVPLATLLAVGIAAAPWALWAAYEWNRARSIRPSQLLTAYGLKSNAVLVLACAAVCVLAWLLLPLWRRADRPSKALLVALLVGLVAVEGTFHWALAPPERGKDRQPDVLVLLVDALRADHVSSYGYERPTTPAIDSLAADGIRFSQAIAQSTFTKASIASLFTGRNPYQHGVYWGSHAETPDSITSDLLSLDEVTLAEVLQERGYLTNAWVQNSHLLDFMGFGQGFVDYHHQQGSIQQIHRRSFPFFRGGAKRYPFFTYLHYIDLHDPYRPKPPYDTLYGTHSDVYAGVDFSQWGAYLEAVRQGEQELSDADVEQMRAYYDGLIHMVDDEIARLLDELKSNGLYDDTLIILTSDHGDAFMEHGFISHSTTPYDELVLVPLIVKLPKQRQAGLVVDEQVRVIDIMPTILHAVGTRVPQDVAGCALQTLWGDDGPERDAACGEAISEIATSGAYPTVAVRTAEGKYIHFEKQPDEFYDLVADPGELEDLGPDLTLTDLLAAAPTDDGSPDAAGVEDGAAVEGDVALDPLEQLRRHLSRVALAAVLQRTDQAETVELTEQQIRELEALGYLKR